MKFTPIKASLLALALFAAPAAVAPAQAAGADNMVVAQAANPQRVENIRKFLANTRNVSNLKDNQLQQRLERARALQNTPNLPSDLMAALQQTEQQLSAELARRQQAGGSQNGNAGQANANAGNGGQQNQAAQGQQQAQQNAAGSAAVDAFLQSAQPAAQLNDAQLRQQMRQAAQLAKAGGMSPDQRKKLRQVIVEARAELATRSQGGTSGQTQAGGQQTSGQAQTQAQTQAPTQAPTQGAAEVDSFLQSVQPVGQLNDAQLRQQMRKAAQLAQSQGASRDQRQKLRQVVVDARAEIAKRSGGTAQNGGNGTQTGNTQQQAPAGSAGAPPASADAAAKLVIDDRTDPSKLSDQELRKRLANMRDILAATTLSPANRKAVRERLARERDLLRSRVGQRNNTDQTNNTDTSQNGTITGNNNTVNNTNVTINNNTVINRETVRVVTNDRRPARDLNDAELRRRINVFEFAINDRSYSERERVEWRGSVERDRRILRDRMLADRDRRRNELRVRVSSGGFNLHLGLNFQPDRPPPPRYVFAAEADEAQLEDILTAPPRRAISRRYSVEEVESNPDLRDAVARIEIDTVRFGFGEGFLREEEINKLDRIAEIMEKILAAYPNEVFMIEGHTDAVGSAEANLQLSRERAQAVKEALVTYYVIPPENLKTVGFGEKYLKIPTQEAEAENRRVSVARITPLVGQLND